MSWALETQVWGFSACLPACRSFLASFHADFLPPVPRAAALTQPPLDGRVLPDGWAGPRPSHRQLAGRGPFEAAWSQLPSLQTRLTPTPLSAAPRLLLQLDFDASAASVMASDFSEPVG